MTPWRERLCRPEIYADVIERLLADPGAWRLQVATLAGDVSLGDLEAHRLRLARALADDVRQGAWRPRPHRAVTLKVGGKTRQLVLPGLLERIVSAAVTLVVSEAMEPLLPDTLWSYRAGRSPHDAVAAFARRVRADRRAHADPRDRGLFVCRRDVQRYTESIPLHRGSPLWPRLARVLDPGRAVDDTLRDPLFAVVVGCVRPVIDRPPRQLWTGLPVGDPINTAIANLYLLEVDVALAGIEGLFSCRYGDDVVFAGRSAATVQRAAQTFAEGLAALGLGAHPDKSIDLFLNAAGRRHADWPEARGMPHVELLGFSITAQGTVALKPNHLRRLLGDLRRRADSVARALAGGDRDTIVGPAVAGVLREALTARGPTAAWDAGRLLSAVTDRDQLRAIDHALARMALAAVTGDPHARAFREVSWAHMRSRWGLPSAAALRNAVPE